MDNCVSARGGIKEWAVMLSLVLAAFFHSGTANYNPAYPSPSRVGSDLCPQLPLYDSFQCSRALFALCDSDWSCSPNGKVCCPTGCGGNTCMYPAGGRQHTSNRFNPQKFNTYLQNNIPHRNEVEVLPVAQTQCPRAPYDSSQCSRIRVAPCSANRPCRAGAMCCPSGCPGFNVCLRTARLNQAWP
jgi:hypothetical protein